MKPRTPEPPPTASAQQREAWADLMDRMGLAVYPKRSRVEDMLERVEDVERMLSAGEWPPRIADRLGVTHDALMKSMSRVGRRDLASALDVALAQCVDCGAPCHKTRCTPCLNVSRATAGGQSRWRARGVAA